jgi:uncharacterized protein YceK
MLLDLPAYTLIITQHAWSTRKLLVALDLPPSALRTTLDLSLALLLVLILGTACCWTLDL